MSEALVEEEDAEEEENDDADDEDDEEEEEGEAHDGSSSEYWLDEDENEDEDEEEEEEEDDESEDDKRRGPRWSWEGYAVDDDQFMTALNEAMASAGSAADRLPLEGCKQLLDRIDECTALVARPNSNHHHVVDKHLLADSWESTETALRDFAVSGADYIELVVARAAIQANSGHPYESYVAMLTLDSVLQRPRQPVLSRHARRLAVRCIELGAVESVRTAWGALRLLLDMGLLQGENCRLGKRTEDLCIHILGALLSAASEETLPGLHWVGCSCQRLTRLPLPQGCLALIATSVRRAQVSLEGFNPHPSALPS